MNVDLRTRVTLYMTIQMALPPEIYMTCSHKLVAVEHASRVCMDCGKETEKQPSFEKEWMLYSSQKPYSDTARCQRRKPETKTIFKDLENMGFSDEIMNLANQAYQEVTDGKTYRGNSRKSVIFACVFNAYKATNNPQSSDALIRIFGMKRKTGLKGLKFVHLNVVGSTTRIPDIRITPCHIISEMLQKFATSKNLCDQKSEIFAIYDYIQANSLMLNRSRPSSIAAGILYYYIVRTRKPITLKMFSSQVEMSELTIKKIAKKIDAVYGTQLF